MAHQSKRSPSLEELPRYDLENVKDENGGDVGGKGGVACPFPWRLHECLEAMDQEGLEEIVSWQPHGRAFTVHQPERFVELVMPRFFGQTKFPSFQRQLNMYGFSRFQKGEDKNAYYHLCFVRGQRNLVRQMTRTKIKGNKGKPRVPKNEPNFYHPAWKNHEEASIPPALRLMKKGDSSQTSIESISDSLSAASDIQTPSQPETSRSSNTTCQRPSFVSTVSLDESMSSWGSSADVVESTCIWDVQDGEKTFFEGSAFHFVDAEDGDLEPIPMKEESSCAPSFIGSSDADSASVNPRMKLVDPVRNIYSYC